MTDLKILENIPLAPYTTFEIGGPARFFCEAKTKKEIIKAIQWAKNKKVRYFILAGGSNVLVADNGFDGLVIKLQVSSYRLRDRIIIAEAGLNLAKLVQLALENSLTGLEWAIGIPGTLGGAIRGNAGAMGHSISEIIKKVEVLIDDKQNQKLKVKKFSNRECKFGYRDSIFKSRSNLIILGAELQLKKGNKEEIRKRMAEYLKKREGQPKEPSAGCIFKNVEIARQPEIQFQEDNKEFVKIRRELVPIHDGKIAAGWLIEQCDLKGKKIGRAKISEKHANFIVNLGGAKAEDVFILISLIKQKVRNKFNIQLEEEIEFVI